MASTRLKVTADVEIPRVPNFLRFDGGTMRVGDVSDDDLRRLGAAWTEALIQRAAQQRRHEGNPMHAEDCGKVVEKDGRCSCGVDYESWPALGLDQDRPE